MYASAMKHCGVMELCGVGFPQNEPTDFEWPAVLKQIEAQNAGLVVCITRDFKESEAEFMLEKGFAPAYKFKNPRTRNWATLWIKDFTGEGCPATRLPTQVITTTRGNRFSGDVTAAPPAPEPTVDPVILPRSVFYGIDRSVDPAPLTWRDEAINYDSERWRNLVNDIVGPPNTPLPPPPPGDVFDF